MTLDALMLIVALVLGVGFGLLLHSNASLRREVRSLREQLAGALRVMETQHNEMVRLKGLVSNGKQ